MQSTDPEKRRAHAKRSKARLRNRVLCHYSNGAPTCVCCGESHPEFLCLDHVDGGGTQHRRQVGGASCGGTMFYYHLQHQGFLPRKSGSPKGDKVSDISQRGTYDEHPLHKRGGST
jgi:hypothetical protein